MLVVTFTQKDRKIQPCLRYRRNLHYNLMYPRSHYLIQSTVQQRLFQTNHNSDRRNDFYFGRNSLHPRNLLHRAQLKQTPYDA